MTRLLSSSSFGLVALSGIGLALAAGACSSDSGDFGPGKGGGGAVAGGPSGGSPGGNTAGAPGSTAGNGSVPTAGTGSAGAPAGTAGSGAGGAAPVGTAGGPGTAGSGGAPPVAVNLPPLVTSAPGAYWKTDGTLTDSTATATVTVNDTAIAQKWEGMGAAFNELGWKFLTTPDMQNKAIGLLFSATDGANFAWGRIPIGASDYAESRYTPEDTAGADPAPNTDESNRPAADLQLTAFSLARGQHEAHPVHQSREGREGRSSFLGQPLDAAGVDEDRLQEE